MKKIFLVIIIFAFSTAFQTREKEVFICTSKSSKKYHLKKDCKGIKRCRSKIKKITKIKALNVGRTKCKLEKIKRQ
ncbi:hypothetical protein CW731_15320 [Polaribacter sp. ALD11]|uniref:hypothetical protein n=1 Tax=Polaribacter sp. ALD11 TaxID=2058137 RepID=UPI000C3013D2|nr:hypothetical protein [Polaribacter sp. ALD11]AUC86567.1 hypothetical protein CW731_15320 [Polaribacter sp. ALD11]